MSDTEAQVNEELLKSVLTSSFTSVSLERKETLTEATGQSTINEPTESPQGPSVSKEERERWEQEQIALQAQWKEESARQRKEAEERRAHIAAERSATGDTWEKLDQEHPPRGPPNQSVEHAGYPGSPSPVDARDSVAGEPSGSKVHALEASQISFASQTTTPEHSQPWEEVPSMVSSYPDITFPEHSSPELSSRHRKSREHHSMNEKRDSSDRKVVSPPSATLSVFDSRLPTSARAWALASALSINLLLPFINGVMLGFGEIFARTIAGRFGWSIPGGSATAVGIGAANKAKQERAERETSRKW